MNTGYFVDSPKPPAGGSAVRQIASRRGSVRTGLASSHTAYYNRCMEEDIEQLRRFLARISPGSVSPVDRAELVHVLGYCWDSLGGSREQAMAEYKLDRMEAPSWNPPVLSFTIERHGATVMGSTRAEKQHWSVNVDKGIAEQYAEGYRQLTPKDSNFDAKPLADELAGIILRGGKDDRLEWSATGSVRLLTGEIIPAGIKRTIEGRKKRLIDEVDKRLAPKGWTRRGARWHKDAGQSGSA
jgi:hypothetical protein